MNSLMEKLMEIESLPEAISLNSKALKATMNHLMDCMTSSEYPSEAASKMKDLVKSQAPKISKISSVYISKHLMYIVKNSLTFNHF
jgi:hypothetical protein